ncbi:uncharacterized protein FRV6_16437 [Fusarium oxysporum]|uniref:Uncharacterized protein n=1 Tax=Fusarium oxysporum TaxID=5507 RepID=A0A2H3UEQ7_FUSOX|nr:uncharacterized protein FRV6_16437 [Fusarium oxysporum]
MGRREQGSYRPSICLLVLSRNRPAVTVAKP